MYIKLTQDEEQTLRAGLEYLIKVSATESSRNAVNQLLKKLEKPEKKARYLTNLSPMAEELFNRMMVEKNKNMYQSLASVIGNTDETDPIAIAERYVYRKRKSFPIRNAEMPALIELIKHVQARSEWKAKGRSI